MLVAEAPGKDGQRRWYFFSVLEADSKRGVGWTELQLGRTEVAEPAGACCPPTALACRYQSPQWQCAYSFLLAGDPGTGWEVQFWVLVLSTLVSPGAPSSQVLGYRRRLLSPSMLLRSSRYCIEGACGGPAEICTTFCTNMSDANTLCQRAYSVSEKDRQGMLGGKWPRGEKNCLRSQTHSVGKLCGEHRSPDFWMSGTGCLRLRVLQTIWVLAGETAPRVRMQIKYDEIEWQRFSDTWSNSIFPRYESCCAFCFSTVRPGY